MDTLATGQWYDIGADGLKCGGPHFLLEGIYVRYQPCYYYVLLLLRTTTTTTITSVPQSQRARA